MQAIGEVFVDVMEVEWAACLARLHFLSPLHHWNTADFCICRVPTLAPNFLSTLPSLFRRTFPFTHPNTLAKHPLNPNPPTTPRTIPFLPFHRPYPC